MLPVRFDVCCGFIIMLSVVILSDILLYFQLFYCSAQFSFLECRYAECRYAGCYGAAKIHCINCIRLLNRLFDDYCRSWKWAFTYFSIIEVISFLTGGLYYKTFCDSNICRVALSQSVCHWQSLSTIVQFLLTTVEHTGVDHLTGTLIIGSQTWPQILDQGGITKIGKHSSLLRHKKGYFCKKLLYRPRNLFFKYWKRSIIDFEKKKFFSQSIILISGQYCKTFLQQ